MLENNRFKILIVDDNPKIYLDFIKILAVNKYDDKIKELRRELFAPEHKIKDYDENLVIDMPVYQIETANQGIDGVEKIATAAKSGNPFSLAFVDIRMPPGIDGIETIKKIWKIDKDIQIIICTAFSDYTWEQTVQHLGLGDNLLILKKPFDSSAVCQMAYALTRKWELARLDRNYISMLEQKQKPGDMLINLHDDIDLDAVVVVSDTGVVEDYNKEFVKIWDLPLECLQKKSFALVLKEISKSLDQKNKMLTDIKRIEIDKQKVITESVTLKDNRIIEYYTQPHKEDGQIIGRLWCFRDITHQKINQLQLEHMATHDALTDLPNRTLLVNFIKHSIATANRKKTIFAVIFIDIDQFKLINDNYSHEMGDELLHQFAIRIRAQTRDSDLFARLGGDEFVLVAQDVTDRSFVTEIVTRLSKLISQPFLISNLALNITASIGFSLYPEEAKSIEQLLHKADLAMYNNKLNMK